MKKIIKFKYKKRVRNNLFTKEEYLNIYKKNLAISKCKFLLNKILDLDDDMIYTKDIMTNTILYNNPEMINSKSKIIKEVYKMQAVAREKVLNVDRKLYHSNCLNESFEYAMLLFIWSVQDKGADIKEDGCLFPFNITKYKKRYYIKFHKSYMDDFVNLCNAGKYQYKKIIKKILKQNSSMDKILIHLIV